MIVKLLAKARLPSKLYPDIPPPWKPDVENEMDTKYIPDEFQRENVAITPVEKTVFSGLLDGPYFQRFSFHGSRQSLSHQSVLSYGESSIPDTGTPTTYQG
ncbi:unnamed protein product [Schistocephalus solidus]|uniref:AGC-kinase C-terminal domain-containing protein n=1 Tax=Schistocephalus solidus TaxID=70667 RepID=A0A183TIB2_SCHSO|nr:unnamed protein product [Schistocephalus solidus]